MSFALAKIYLNYLKLLHMQREHKVLTLLESLKI